MDGTVGVIGLGTMGSAIAANLLDAGFAVVGRDAAGARQEALAARGGRGLPTPCAVAEAADVVLLSLPSEAAFDEVLTGEDGIASAGRGGLIVADTSTLPLAVKERGRDALRVAGAILLDCPLSGTGAQAAVKDLAVYASGDRAAFERCPPVFEGFARSHVYLGAFGNGSRMKFVANLLVAIHNVAAAEAFVLGRKAGLDPETVYKVIADGAGSSRMFEVRGPMMATGDYEPPSISVELWKKDMRVIGEFAAELGAPTPLFAATGPLYAAAAASGNGGRDTASVCAVLEAMAGLPPPAA